MVLYKAFISFYDLECYRAWASHAHCSVLRMVSMHDSRSSLCIAVIDIGHDEDLLHFIMEPEYFGGHLLSYHLMMFQSWPDDTAVTAIGMQLLWGSFRVIAPPAEDLIAVCKHESYPNTWTEVYEHKED